MHPLPPPPPIALTIAGSDSGGGAGIQADLRTFHTFGVHGTTAITAITEQNTRGVFGIHSIPLPNVRGQIRVVADDLPPDAVKTGMLATAELVELVADEVRLRSLPNLVVDPVMVATSGDRLLQESAEAAVARVLLPLATLVTPNLPEARILTGLSVTDEEGMERAARRLVEMGAGAALVKGGHLPGGEAIDLLWDGARLRVFRHPRLASRSTHGTGCTLSAAIAAGLAHGRPLPVAVRDGIDFVHRAIAEAPGLGAGHGPVNHFVPARSRPGESSPSDEGLS